MLIYLDICCLKRPFDDPSVSRNKLECEAVLALLALENEALQFVRSQALFLENGLNRVKWRAARVEAWLRKRPVVEIDEVALASRTEALMQMGFNNFDALHVATAELAGAGILGTSDDKFLGVARRNAARLKIRIIGILELAAEMMK